jgi:hypothetical protein
LLLQGNVLLATTEGVGLLVWLLHRVLPARYCYVPVMGVVATWALAVVAFVMNLLAVMDRPAMSIFLVVSYVQVICMLLVAFTGVAVCVRACFAWLRPAKSTSSTESFTSLARVASSTASDEQV